MGFGAEETGPAGLDSAPVSGLHDREVGEGGMGSAGQLWPETGMSGRRMDGAWPAPPCGVWR